MAETIEKKYVDLAGLGHYDEKIKKVISDADAATLNAAKAHAESLGDQYDAAGTAQTKVDELANGAVKANTDAIAKLNGDDTVEGSVAKAIKDAKTTIEGEIEDSKYDDTALKGRVTAVEGAITTLNGTGDGSVKKQIDDAFNEFATNVTDDGVVNTYKELIDYCATHSAEAAEMAGEISKNAEAIKTLETYVGKLPEGTDAKTVIEYINAKVAAVDFSDAIATAKQEAIDASKTYSDGLAKNYATAAQGAKADTALQEADVTDLRADVAANKTGVADVKASLAEGGDTNTAIKDAKKAGTDASAAVTALADGQVATNKTDIADLQSKVETLQSTTYTAITNEEIDTLFATKAE